MNSTHYRVVTHENGASSILDDHYGETMHSWIGPVQEAQFVYLEQSRLQKQLQLVSEDPLIIHDVGLGIGANALACIELFNQIKSKRDVHLISFENDIQGIEFALGETVKFPFLQKNSKLVQELLQSKQVIIKPSHEHQLKWDLIEGDYHSLVLQTLSPDLIFYDFYSPKACPHLWNLSAFQTVFQSTEGKRKGGKSSTLCTYSTSTWIRTAMLLGGFYVGHGISTDCKRETTVASTQKSDLVRPLTLEWLKHWKRSGNAIPPDVSEENRAQIEDKLYQLLLRA